MNVRTEISTLLDASHETDACGPEVTTFSPASQTIIARDEYVMPDEAL